MVVVAVLTQHRLQFEVRQGEIDRARAIYNRFVACHPTVRALRALWTCGADSPR